MYLTKSHKLSVASIALAFFLLAVFCILDFMYQKSFVKTEVFVNNITKEDNKNTYYIEYFFQYKDNYMNKIITKRGEIKEKIGSTNIMFYNEKKGTLSGANIYFKIPIALIIIFLVFIIPITVFRIEV